MKDEQPFVDLFCGSCNIITKIDDNRVRIANDKHKYLISMWKELQNGWTPPQNLTREEYINIKNNKDVEFIILKGNNTRKTRKGEIYEGHLRKSDKEIPRPRKKERRGGCRSQGILL